MKEELSDFDFGDWWAKLVMPIYESKRLVDFLHSRKAIEAYFSEKEITTIDEIGIITKTFDNVDEEIRKHWLEDAQSEFKYAGFAYQNHLAVSSFSYIEEMLSDIVRRLINASPMLLKRVEQINPDFRIKNAFSLEDLISESHSSQVIELIVRRAVSFIVLGEIKKTLKRIENLTKVTFKRESIDFLSRMQNLRNKIVHESHVNLERNVSIDSVVENYEILFETIRVIFDKYQIGYVESQKASTQ